MSNQKLSVNKLREIKNVLLNKKQQDLENDIENNTNITELLLLIFNKVFQEGCTEISLNNEEMKEYTIELKKILETLNISNSLFIKKTIDRSAMILKETIIQTLYEEDCGCYDDETEKLYISANRCIEYKDVKTGQKNKKIVEALTKMIIKKNQQPQQKTKKLTNKNNS